MEDYSNSSKDRDDKSSPLWTWVSNNPLLSVSFVGLSIGIFALMLCSMIFYGPVSDLMYSWAYENRGHIRVQYYITGALFVLLLIMFIFGRWIWMPGKNI